MGFREVEWAMSQPIKNATDKAVLAAIARYVDGAKRCWPSLQTLCDDTAFHRATIKRACRRLAASGYIEMERRGGEKGVSRQTSNYYRLLRTPSNLRGAESAGEGRAVHPLEPITKNLPTSKPRNTPTSQVEDTREGGASPLAWAYSLLTDPYVEIRDEA